MITKNMMGLGMQSMVAQSVIGTLADSLTATGANQANAYLISNDRVIFSVVPAGSGARLPVGDENDTYQVMNDSGNDLLLYPPVGGRIGGAAVNSPLNVPAGQSVKIFYQDYLTIRIDWFAFFIGANSTFVLKTDLAAPGGAASVGIAAAGGITSSTVQAALQELDTKKAPVDNPSFTTAATVQGNLVVNSNLLVGVTSGTSNVISKTVGQGTSILRVNVPTGEIAANFMAVATQTFSATGCAAALGANSSTSRSINAAGTINASGTDYAEYYRKAESCGDIAKGQIVGIDMKGQLTDKWASAVSFLVKSTDPSYVGGDSWGTDEALGMAKPAEPICEDEAEREIFETVTMPAYTQALAEFEAALERARQRVDRMAFAGQVPVNVLGAEPGQYVIPVQKGDGITGVSVSKSNMTLAQYVSAIGIVQNVLPDGRANVRVKVF